MKPDPHPSPRTRRGAGRAGFTLLEVVLAAAILGILSLTVYQFTTVTMRMAGYSMQDSENTLACGGLRRLLEAQLASLPVNQTGALVGMKVDRKGGERRDALQLVCPAGNGLLTPDARGLYEVTWTVREIPRGSGRYCLGMERTPWEADDDDDDDDDGDRPKASSTKVTDVTRVHETLPSDWVGLMDGVQSLECSYYDARLNGWVEKWTDASTLPNLVRMRLSLVNGGAPYEIVERVPGGAANARVIPTVTQSLPGVTTGGVPKSITPGVNH